ncbi:hypothetical protein HMPREF0262_01005 [Clostridium sp. ATCC 29733]|nr:hypothetical protein HMPREF0262_01005 [Clostridium sp. ATCC 29733]
MGKERGHPTPLPQGEAEQSLCPTAARRGGAASLPHRCEERRNGLSVPLLRGEAERPLCPTAARRSGAAPLSHRCKERRNGLSAPPLRGEAERPLCPTAARRRGEVGPSAYQYREKGAGSADTPHGRKGKRGRRRREKRGEGPPPIPTARGRPSGNPATADAGEKGWMADGRPVLMARQKQSGAAHRPQGTGAERKKE